jgi:DNA-binding NarL/FixJ family response regulator
MTRVIVVADSGSALAGLTRGLSRTKDVEIVRYANGQSNLGPLLRRFAPDLVLLDERRAPAVALDRIAEVVRAAGRAPVIVLVPWSVGWVPDALRAGAAAVLPVDVDPSSLDTVIHEVLAPGLVAAAGG